MRSGNEHILAVGDEGEGFLRTIWEVAGTTAISLLTAVSRLDRHTALREFEMAFGVGDNAPLSQWADAAAAVHRVRPVTRVIAMYDQFLVIAAHVAQALGIEGPDSEIVRVTHHKAAYRAWLDEAGVQPFPSKPVACATEVVRFADKHGWPVVVKPAYGTGGSGITVVTSADATEAAFDHARCADAEVLVETYQDGPTYDVQTFSENGEHLVIAIAREYNYRTHPVIRGIALPAVLDPADRKAIEDHVAAVLTSLGHRDGPTDCDLVLTPSGPVVIETHLRMGGDRITDLVRDALGVDIKRAYAAQLLGKRVLPRLRTRLEQAQDSRKASAMWFASPGVDGTLVEVHGLDTLSEHPQVDDFQLRVHPGDRVTPVSRAAHRVLAFKVDDTDAEAAVRTAEQLAGRIRFVVAVAPHQSGGTSPK
nr:ATP-grasp domain-containing protein [Kibdelosporangium sp. MJ126-NF4]CEL20873.1 carboxylase [Kibdelosporangium sp. MJ126-NF4]CTQ98322.1 carboxylase [Kibdelosporangium sp. MJ126-NF4]